MIPLDYGVLLVTRAEWGARSPTSITKLNVDMDTDHWEGPHMGTFPHESCATKVRGIQNFHMDERGWTDIAYNTISCPHGYVFEGRGQGRRSAANGTSDGNSRSYAECYLGGQGDGFTEAGKRAMKAAGNWMTRVGSQRVGHRDWKNTECPGNDIYHWVHLGQPITLLPPVTNQGKKKMTISVCEGPDGYVHMFLLGDPDGEIWHYFAESLEDLEKATAEHIGSMRERLGGLGKAIDAIWFKSECAVFVHGTNNKVWMRRFIPGTGWTPNWVEAPPADLLPI